MTYRYAKTCEAQFGLDGAKGVNQTNPRQEL